MCAHVQEKLLDENQSLIKYETERDVTWSELFCDLIFVVRPHTNYELYIYIYQYMMMVYTTRISSRSSVRVALEYIYYLYISGWKFVSI